MSTNTDILKAKNIFEKNINLHGCGYYEVCAHSYQCSNCNMNKELFDYNIWESLRKELQNKFKDFWGE